MHTDFALLTGSNHRLTACQDYTLASPGVTETEAWALVADGCSTGRRSDLGARVWALAAEAVLTSGAAPTDLAQFADAVTRHAEPGLAAIQPQDRLATLVVAHVLNAKLQVHIFGDGFFLAKTGDGRIQFTNVVQARGAPRYLDYDRNPDSLLKWADEFGGNANVQVITHVFDETGSLESLRTVTVAPDDRGVALTFDLNKEDFDVVVVSTDGALGAGEGLFKTVRGLVDFKNVRGEFLKRRVGFMAKQWANAGQMPSDDLGVAGIWLRKVADDE